MNSIFSGKKIGVLGLGRTGNSIMNVALDAEVITYDDKKSHENLDKWKNLDYVIPSPGVRLDHKMLQNQKVVSDIDLFFIQNRKARYIGVTGTNGKSTLAASIHWYISRNRDKCENKGFFDIDGVKIEMLSNTFLAGNIGIPVFNLRGVDDESIVILELSSFQLDIIKELELEIGIITNITPDHLERYNDDFELYKKSKMKIKDISKNFFFGDIDPKHIASIILKKEIFGNFPGLPHRQEFVRKIGNTVFINDSKATNFASTKFAFANYENIFWLAGGISKADKIYGIEAYKNKVKKAYFYGKSKDEFKSIAKGIIDISLYEDMTSALNQAFYDTFKEKDAVILLSPACASQDQFRDYAERGEIFKRHVKCL